MRMKRVASRLLVILPLLASGGAAADLDNYVAVSRGKALVTAGNCGLS
ncbi:hypothetical protein ACVIGB_008424 [Bradyrhizobium sp. USDA 4341]